MATPTVLLLCHDAALAMRWRQLLQAGGRLKVVGITNAAASARAMLQRGGGAVDVVVSDLSIMAGTTNGAIHALRGGSKADLPLVVMVTDRIEEPLLLAALRGGADSYHVGALDTLADSVLAALAGESAIAPPIAKQVLERFDASVPSTDEDPMGETPLQLTAAERTLLTRVAAGETVAKVADKDNVHARMLGTVVRGIYRKLRWILRANVLSLSLDSGFTDSGFQESVWGALKPPAGRNR